MLNVSDAFFRALSHAKKAAILTALDCVTSAATAAAVAPCPVRRKEPHTTGVEPRDKSVRPDRVEYAKTTTARSIRLRRTLIEWNYSVQED